MEPKWNVPSLDHDTGVKVDQNLTWPRPGPEWLTVSLDSKILSISLLLPLTVI